MKIELTMTETLPTVPGVYYMLLKKNRQNRAAAVRVYIDGVGRLMVRPVDSQGIVKTLASRAGTCLFSSEPVDFIFKNPAGEVVSNEYPV